MSATTASGTQSPRENGIEMRDIETLYVPREAAAAPSMAPWGPGDASAGAALVAAPATAIATSRKVRRIGRLDAHRGMAAILWTSPD